MRIQQFIKVIMSKLMAHFAWISDIVSSKIMKEFMTLTIHSLTEDFDMICFMREVEQLEGKYTSDFIQDCLENPLADRK
jgi:hypothetical protein